MGSSLVSHWENLYPISIWHTNDIVAFLAANISERKAMLKEFDVVVNCAVVKTGMHSRSVTLESAQINSLLPRLLVESANDDRCFLIHFSSDLYALGDWENGYSIEKTFGDIFLRGTNSIIFRGAFFGLHSKAEGFLNYVKSGYKGALLSGYVNVFSQAIYIDSLIGEIEKSIIGKKEKSGIITYGTSTLYTKYKLINDILTGLGINDHVLPVSRFDIDLVNEQIFSRRLDFGELANCLAYDYELVVDQSIKAIRRCCD